MIFNNASHNLSQSYSYVGYISYKLVPHNNIASSHSHMSLNNKFYFHTIN